MITGEVRYRVLAPIHDGDGKPIGYGEQVAAVYGDIEMWHPAPWVTVTVSQPSEDPDKTITQKVHIPLRNILDIVE